MTNQFINCNQHETVAVVLSIHIVLSSIFQFWSYYHYSSLKFDGIWCHPNVVCIMNSNCTQLFDQCFVLMLSATIDLTKKKKQNNEINIITKYSIATTNMIHHDGLLFCYAVASFRRFFFLPPVKIFEFYAFNDQRIFVIVLRACQ